MMENEVEKVGLKKIVVEVVGKVVNYIRDGGEVLPEQVPLAAGLNDAVFWS